MLAAALRTHLSETRFTFTGLTGEEATLRISRAAAEWDCEAPRTADRPHHP